MSRSDFSEVTAQKEPKRDSTRRRIVSRAAKILRERGLSGSGINDVMAAAGLTHGAFYAHFQNKTALVKDAVNQAFDEAKHWLFGTVGERRGREWIISASKRYLRREHVENPGAGCVIVALSADLARSDADVRTLYTERVQNILSEITYRIGDDSLADDDKRMRAVALFSMWVGVLTVARPLTDPRLVDELLRCAQMMCEEMADKVPSRDVFTENGPAHSVT